MDSNYQKKDVFYIDCETSHPRKREGCAVCKGTMPFSNFMTGDRMVDKSDITN
jgi:hypothetical protein